MADTEPGDLTADTAPRALPDAAAPPAREAAPVATPAAEPPPRRSGLAGVLAGGGLAAALGFLLAQAVPQGWPLAVDDQASQRLAAQEQSLAALQAEIARLAALPAPDSTLPERVARLESAPAPEMPQPDLGPLEQRLADLEARLAAQPAAAAAPAEGAPASQALADLQAEVLALKAADGAGQLKALAAETERLRREALDAIAQATAAAGLGRLQSALETGAPYGAALAALGTEAPEALRAQAEAGIPTMAALKALFPPAARRALDAERRADTGAGWGARLVSFLGSQTGARALSPREGSGPDAVLSRAEAALAAGDLAASLTELAALPEPGRAAMQDWLDLATTRAAAEAAVADIARTLGQ